MTNPLLEKTAVPAFDQIKPEHFEPAFKQAFAEAEQTYQSLRGDNSLATFENTVAPFDTLFAEAGRLFRALAVFTGNARSKATVDIQAAMAKESSALSKTIFQDRVLAERFRDVYDRKDSLSLDDEDRWFMEDIYRSFESSGALLDDLGRKRIKEIDFALINAAKQFAENLEGNEQIEGAQKQQSFLVTDLDELKGVPQGIIGAFEKQAKEANKAGWLFIPERLQVDELLKRAENREFRQKIHESLNRLGTQAPFDNTTIIEEMLQLRHERAKLLGYTDFAEYQLSRSMAGSLPRIETLLRESIDHILPRYEADMKTLEEWTAQNGGPAKLEPWDVTYYEGKYKEATFKFDGKELSDYLEFDNVMQGWLNHASKAMGIDFEETRDHPIWHEDVRCYKTTDRDTGEEGVLYIDPFARLGSKRSGAWASGLQGKDPAEGRLQAIGFNMNLARSPQGKVLMDEEQTTTFYHEGGHGLNGLKGTRPKYRSHRGTGNGSAYVEIHSMLQENAAFHDEILPAYTHKDTGAAIPPALIKAMRNADSFLKTREVLKLLQNSLRDLLFHATDPADYKGPEAIEQAADIESDYSAHVRSYPLLRFDHLFSGGLSQYAAGYWGYYWSDVAQAAAFEPFGQKGLYDPGLLQKMQDFYAIGAGLEPNLAYETFTDKPAGDLTAYLKGLDIQPGKPAQAAISPPPQPGAPAP